MVDRIAAEKLKEKMDRDEDFFLIDTRQPFDFQGWHIKDAINFPYIPSEGFNSDKFRSLANREGISEEEEILTICAKGISSHQLAEKLEEEGYSKAKAVDGGMQAWSGVYDTVNISTKNEDIKITQLQRRAKGCLGYLVGSKSGGEAAAIDVSRYTHKFVEAASAAGFKITAVFDTHIHADHISGGRKLADKLEVPYFLGSEALERTDELDFRPVDRNQVVTVGGVKIKAIHTPGHTSEMTSWLIEDEALISGDSLFVDSVGRTELEFQEEGGKRGARLQYDSLKNRVMSLPDTVKVLPGHFSLADSGETPGVTPGTPIFSTIGNLRGSNEALKMGEEEFIAFLTGKLPTKPPNYEEIIELNLGEAEAEEEKAIELELGPNRCAATEESMTA